MNRQKTVEKVCSDPSTDFAIENARGSIAAYADAKAGEIVFNDQAKGFVLWSATSESRTLVYYVPRPVEVPSQFLDFARQNHVQVITVLVK